MGQCPCPDCLIEKNQIALMGTKLDMKRRRDKARQDSDARQQHVNRTRKWIYELGDRVNAKKIEDLFHPTSAVPNRVRIMVVSYANYNNRPPFRTHSRNAYFSTDLIFTGCLYRILCMNLSWVCGGQSLHI